MSRISWGKKSHRIVLVILVIIAGLIGSTAGDYWLINRRIQRVEITAANGLGNTFLLVGSDSRSFIDSAAERATYSDRSQASGERADFMLLIRIPDSGAAQALAIPRDLLVPGPDGIPRRLTTTLMSGPGALIDRLCQGLGIAVDHLVLLDFPGLIAAVDAVGGFPISLPYPLRDRQAKLFLPRAGAQRLNGEQALAYARSRQPQQLRAGRWQEAPELADRLPRLLAVFRFLSQASNRPWSAQKIAWSISPHLRLDQRLGLRAQWKLGRHLSSLDSGVPTLPTRLVPGKLPLAWPTEQTESALSPWKSPLCIAN